MQYGTEFIKIAVVDDEPLWQQRTVEIIEKECGLDAPHIDRYAGGQALLDAQIFYDLLFMDVEMKGLDGFETAQRYQRQYKCTKIAMLTSHTELSRRGYVINAFRYIDKQCMEPEIKEALLTMQIVKEKERSIEVNVVGLGVMPIMIKDIISVNMNRRNILIHTRKGDYISSLTMHEIEDMLDGCGFYRSHRSYLINLDETLNYQGMDILMCDGSRAYLSKDRRAEFKDRLLSHKYEMANG